MRRTTASFGLLVALGLAVPACALAPQNLPAGSRCLRSTQCNPGLVCTAGVCSADLDGFGGTVPVIDAAIDAPPGLDADLDAAMEDAGPLPDVPGLDAFVPPFDGGTDAFVPVDAPVVMPDAPPDMPDAPPDMPDAPPDMPDAPPDMPDAP